MLYEKHRTIYMDEGDFGLSLPFKIKIGVEPADIIRFSIKKNKYIDEVIIEKEFSNLADENDEFVFDLEITKEESERLKEGTYKWGIKQYRNDELLNTIVDEESFIVKKGV